MTTNTQPQTQQSGGDELLRTLWTTIYPGVRFPSKEPDATKPMASMLRQVRKLADVVEFREQAARIEELQELNFYGYGNDKQTLAALYTHKLLRLQQLKPQAGEGGEI